MIKDIDKYVFISYSTRDKNMADAICHYLEESGVPCWIAPRDILAGQSWAGAIVKAIRGCAAMILVYSKESNSSHQVANEIDKAFSCAKVIIPFIMDSTPMNDDFDYYLSRKHWLIAYPDYKEQLKPLYDVVVRNVPDLVPSQPMVAEKETAEPLAEEIGMDDVRLEEVTVAEEYGKKQSLSFLIGSLLARKQIDGKVPLLVPQWSEDVTDEVKSAINDMIAHMVWVEGGTFLMGATEEQKRWACADEKPAHRVTLSSYYICKFEVTQKEWQTVMGDNPSKNKGKNCPVTRVSKLDCDRFAEKLSACSGLCFSLPTEAQWEFAARGGNQSKGYIYSGSNELKEVGWGSSEYKGHPQSVGGKAPNELGIYDMSGNVSEWCCESKGKYTEEEVTDPKSIYKVGWLQEGQYVFRGGDYLSRKNCRVSYRASLSDDYKSDTIGLRLVINV